MTRYPGVFVLSAASALAQISASTSQGPGGFGGSARFGPPPPFAPAAITGAAYSGEEVSEFLQVLADGTRIARNMPGAKLYRDSAGRTRTERPMFRSMPGRPGGPESPLIIEITDPVARVKYFLDTENKVAHRQELPAAGAPSGRMFGGVVSAVRGGVGPALEVRAAAPPPNAPPATADLPRPESSREELGGRIIDGVAVEGMRYTTTWPEGSEGNDRPIKAVTETWTSPELKVTILSRRFDPRSGEHTQKLINLSRVEPDPGLFQPPPGYTVVDEKGEFTIRWGSQQR